MISPSGNFKLYLASKPVDFRKGADNSIADELMGTIGFPASASYDEVCALLEQHLAWPTVKSVDWRVRRVHIHNVK